MLARNGEVILLATFEAIRGSQVMHRSNAEGSQV